jgi:hypothetical protein
VIFESGCNLKRIEKKAFYGSGLKSIRILSTVELIEEECFFGCGSLTEVIFESGSNLKRIEKSAFRSSGLKSIRIPSIVEFIGKACFFGCESLKEVIFESGCNLKRIERSAFYGSGLKSIRIPSTVELIGESCFFECKFLNEVIFENSSLKEIGTGALFDSGVESIEIPEKCEVLDGALSGIKSVSIHSGNCFFVKEGDFVISKDKKKLIRYFGCSSRIVVPKSIEFIGEYCFVECKSLDEVIFESGCNLKRIEKGTFSRSGLKSIRIPSTVEFIGEECFSRCKFLKEVIFEGKSVISPRAFSGSRVKVVMVPVGVKLNFAFDKDCIIEFVAK